MNAPPEATAMSAAGADPDLLALPAPPKRERTATVVLMIVTAIAAAWMASVLVGEARYALTPGHPLEIGDLATLKPGSEIENRYVRASGMFATAGAIRYGRAAESDSFRLAPIAGNPDIWVEIRIPEGFEGPRFVPPTSFAGRLVPFEKAGIRHRQLRDAVREQGNVEVSKDAWLLVDGSSPRASRWAVALVVLFFGFAAWNLIGVARMLHRIRDPETKAPATE